MKTLPLTKKHKGTIMQGDCLLLLETFPKESIDLIYLDPPFFSGTNYDIVWDNGAELAAYTDSQMYWADQPVDMADIERQVDEMRAAGILSGTRQQMIRKLLLHRRGRVHRGGILGYVDYMRPRIKALYRVLKPTGSIYLHCDFHANAHLRIIMDDVFGQKNFQNEIIWHYRTGGATKRRFSRKHDTIYFYSKTPDFKFNSIRERVYYEKPFFSPNVDNEGRYYADVLPVDVWQIPAVINVSKERLGYPTQKPERLLEKIITASSDKGDIVLDPFVGGGTTMVVAHRLGRRYIGMDISPSACAMVLKNFERKGYPLPKPIHFDAAAEVKALEMTRKLHNMSAMQFERWGRMVLNAKPAPHHLGIDGILADGAFLEIKHWRHKVGRPVIHKFIGQMKTGIQKGPRKGIIVGFKFSAEAKSTVQKLQRDKYMGARYQIKLLTVHEILIAKFKNRLQDLLAWGMP